MMKKTLFIASMALLCGGSASAGTYTIADTWYDWPGYVYKTGNVDEIGFPQIDKMKITLSNDNALLTQVQIVMRSSHRQLFDSLFINTNWNNKAVGQAGTNWDQWKQYVHAGNPNNVGNSVGIDANDGLWKVTNPAGYTFAAANTGSRTGQPDGLAATSLGAEIKTAANKTFTPVFDYNTNTLTYDFTKLLGGGLALTHGLFVAYDPWCANDIIGGGVAVPEPATLFLFGTGIIGLAGLARRKATPTV